MSENIVHFEIKNKKAYLQINRPNALNALNKNVLTEIRDCCEILKDNKQIQVLIVSGSGDKSFVAGADIKELQELHNQNKEGENFSQWGAEIFSKLEQLPQITIARVQGFALGGGLELALACDFIIASEKARFSLPEVTLGLIPGFSGTQRLAKRIGSAKAIEWIVTAERYSATEALACGLVNHVVKSEDLIAFTEQIAEKIIKNAPLAVKTAKKVIQASEDSTFKEGCDIESKHFGLLLNQSESAEGISAFIEKRPAQF
ncbi:enoyl-CoA hydratase/isomerase family protein [Fluviispira multicolorata]|uniref:Crotonase n=1 Tax=Fluviispira multicolorata TaxID=2654512 RepID=A0A833JF24_9BACT|nr:enoyl-CoA hydratase/isomerase family protein [Fluviispira multicolorata]KAB8030805.1 crotonase [Fluviispira multicolorata]